MKIRWLSALCVFGAVAAVGGCGSDDEGEGSGGSSGGNGGSAGRPENTGAACEVADDCFGDVTADGGVIGEATCLDRVEGGYCTHTCETDDDCCAVEGECDTDLRQVCAPFESLGQKFCFLSCEEEDVNAGTAGASAGGAAGDDGVDDDTEYCRREAGSAFICRSTGGGAQNRKVCVPEGDGSGSAAGAGG